jgi:adenine nucleotide transporter 17
LVQVSNPTIKFTVYESLKRLTERLTAGRTVLTAFEAFLLGAVASAVATTLTYPIQVVQTKSRVSKKFFELTE